MKAHINEENESNLVVYVPESLNLSGFGELSQQLSTVFKQLSIIDEFSESPSFAGFDVGTNWILLDFLSEAALSLFGSIVDIVTKSAAKFREQRILKMQFDELKMEHDIRMQLLGQVKQRNQKICEDCTSEFIEENQLTLDDEDRARINHAVDDLERIMETGVTFEAALKANSAVRQKFSEQNKQHLLDKEQQLEMIKRLSEGKTADKE